MSITKKQKKYLVIGALGLGAFALIFLWRRSASAGEQVIEYEGGIPRTLEDLTLRPIYFDFDTAAIDEEGRRRLGEMLARLSTDSRSLRITGYTDSDGAEAYNIALSRQRAQAVANALIAGGLPAGRLDVRGLGEANPIADNATEEGKARNRRVDIEIAR